VNDRHLDNRKGSEGAIAKTAVALFVQSWLYGEFTWHSIYNSTHAVMLSPTSSVVEHPINRGWRFSLSPCPAGPRPQRASQCACWWCPAARDASAAAGAAPACPPPVTAWTWSPRAASAPPARPGAASRGPPGAAACPPAGSGRRPARPSVRGWPRGLPVAPRPSASALWSPVGSGSPAA
jgi:hypothetical protein